MNLYKKERKHKTKMLFPANQNNPDAKIIEFVAKKRKSVEIVLIMSLLVLALEEGYSQNVFLQ